MPLSSQRRPPARPSFACSQECASSSETPSPTRALWRSRPRKSYQVQTHSVSRLSCPIGELTCTESFLIKCFSRGTRVSISYHPHDCESSCDSCEVDFLLCAVHFFFSTLQVKSGTKPKFQLKLTQTQSRTSMFKQTADKKV